MNKDLAIKIYREYEKKINAYYLMLSIANFDKETIAPIDGCEYRNNAMAIIAGEVFELKTNKELIEAINYLYESDLDYELKREISLAKKELDNTINFKKEDVIEFDLACNDAFDAWYKAKCNNDYCLFEENLKKLIELSKKRAYIRDKNKDAYDLYLDDYEEGMNKRKYDIFFNKIKEELLPLIKKVKDKDGYIDDSFLYKYYPKDIQEKFVKEILLKYISFDASWGYMGISEHPFTDGFSKGDVRITTSYDEHNITSTIFSVIHEAGHAYYEHQVDDKYEGTNIKKFISSGMHESQSRFMENYIARRKSFWVNLYPRLQEYFPENLKDVSLDQFVKAINVSRPSLIRTDADELTYPIHILIRYEIEKGIFNGDIKVDDLNKTWNKMYKDNLGIAVLNDRDGILQDVHWSGASFGYFPTYALGSAIGAQLLNKLNEDIDIDKCLENNEFVKIESYLKDNLQKYGSLYDFNTLVKMFTNEDFNPNYYIDYLKNKYQNLYNL